MNVSTVMSICGYNSRIENNFDIISTASSLLKRHVNSAVTSVEIAVDSLCVYIVRLPNNVPH